MALIFVIVFMLLVYIYSPILFFLALIGIFTLVFFRVKSDFKEKKINLDNVNDVNSVDLFSAKKTYTLAKPSNVKYKKFSKYYSDYRRYKDPIFVFTDNKHLNSQWLKWDIESHHSKDQYWRRRNSFEINPVLIDYHNLEGIFIGSNNEIYFNSLSSCDCMDYMKRNVPCKHMYRLFYEFENGTVEDFDNTLGSRETMYKLKQLEEKTVKEYIDISTNYKNNFYYTTSKNRKAIKQLLSESLITLDENKNFNIMLNQITKDDIVQLLKSLYIKDVKSSMKKQDLIDWAIDNYLDELNKHFKNTYHIIPNN